MEKVAAVGSAAAGTMEERLVAMAVPVVGEVGGEGNNENND